MQCEVDAVSCWQPNNGYVQQIEKLLCKMFVGQQLTLRQALILLTILGDAWMHERRQSCLRMLRQCTAPPPPTRHARALGRERA